MSRRGRVQLAACLDALFHSRCHRPSQDSCHSSLPIQCLLIQRCAYTYIHTYILTYMYRTPASLSLSIYIYYAWLGFANASIPSLILHTKPGSLGKGRTLHPSPFSHLCTPSQTSQVQGSRGERRATAPRGVCVALDFLICCHPSHRTATIVHTPPSSLTSCISSWATQRGRRRRVHRRHGASSIVNIQCQVLSSKP